MKDISALSTLPEIKDALRVRLRNTRVKMMLNQVDLSKRSGVSLSTIRSYEQKGEISLDKFLKLAVSLKQTHALNELFNSLESIEDVIESDDSTPKRFRKPSSSKTMNTKRIPFDSVGEIISEDYLKPSGLTQAKAASMMGIPSSHLNEIIKGKRKIGPDMAVRIGKLFGMKPETWLKLQAEYELRTRK